MGRLLRTRACLSDIACMRCRRLRWPAVKYGLRRVQVDHAEAGEEMPVA